MFITWSYYFNSLYLVIVLHYSLVNVLIIIKRLVVWM